MSRQKKEGEASATVASYTQEDEGKEEITEGKEEDSGGKQGEPEDVEEKKDERETEEHRHSIQEQRKAQEQQEPIVSEKERKKELKLFEKKWKEDVVQRAEKHKQAKDNANLRNIEDVRRTLFSSVVCTTGFDESMTSSRSTWNNYMMNQWMVNWKGRYIYWNWFANRTTWNPSCKMVRDDKLTIFWCPLLIFWCKTCLADPSSTDALLGALARVLRDDFKKNVELTTVLMQIFYWYVLYVMLHVFLF